MQTSHGYLFSLCVQGGGPIIFTFTPPLPSAVTSVRATFEWLGTRELKKVEDGSWLGYFPGSVKRFFEGGD